MGWTPPASATRRTSTTGGSSRHGWGVVPRQHSSGGKPTLLGMSKRGDAYLRTMLIHGARSVIYRATQRADADSWLVKLTTRRNKNVAAVAMANKTARTVWVLLAHGREFKPEYAVAECRIDHTDSKGEPYRRLLRQPARRWHDRSDRSWHSPRRTRHFECV